jgi:O-acetyl-ADP-ribose deacetylase (regulator of RNase III)
MPITVIEGDLLDQPVEVIVNSWNRNFIPPWLLWPQGVSGAIRRRAGSGPLHEVSRHGLLPVGAAVLTSAGKLPFRGIIHVAGLQWWWTATTESVRLSTRNAMRVYEENGFQSMAFPLIGAGTGGLTREKVLALMQGELQPWSDRDIRIVRFATRT